MAISLELRKKIVVAYEKGLGSYQKLADIFGVGICTVRRCVEKSKKNEPLECLLYKGGRKPGISDEELPFVAQLVEKKPEITMAQIQTSFKEIKSKEVSKQMVETALRKMDLTKKKKALWHLNRKPSGFKKGAMNLNSSAKTKITTNSYGLMKPAATSIWQAHTGGAKKENGCPALNQRDFAKTTP